MITVPYNSFVAVANLTVSDMSSVEVLSNASLQVGRLNMLDNTGIWLRTSSNMLVTESWTSGPDMDLWIENAELRADIPIYLGVRLIEADLDLAPPDLLHRRGQK